jgi:predicted TPR repeat methyltransferase
MRRAGQLVGVDISPRMVQKASQRHIYNQLITGDMVELIAQTAASERFDLIVSADVLVYYGSLDFVFFALRRALRKGTGLLAFTVEALDAGQAEEWLLRPSGRYAHSRRYLETTASKHDMSVLDFRDDIVLRKDRGEPVPGFLILMGLAPVQHGKGDRAKGGRGPVGNPAGP